MAGENRSVDAVRDLLLGSDLPEEEAAVGGPTAEDGEELYYDENGELVDSHGNSLVMGSDGVLRTAAQAAERRRAEAAMAMSESYTEPFDVRDNFAEYAFARSIERHNLWVMMNPDAGGRYVTVRQGRDLRRQVEDILVAKFGPDSKKKPGLDMKKPVLGQVPYDELMSAMGRAFAAPMNENPLWHVPETNGTERAVAASRRRAEMDDLKKDYIVAVTGRGYGNDAVPPVDLDAGTIDLGRGAGGFLVPLSPYTPEFRDTGTFRENGGRILYAPAMDVDMQPGQALDGTLELKSGSEAFRSAGYLSVGADGAVRKPGDGSGVKNLIVLERMDGYERDRLWADAGDGAATPVDGIRTAEAAGPMVGESDMTGLSLLRDYMTPAEFRDAQAWIEAYTNEDGSPGHVSQKMASMALAVCEELRNRGFEFSIERDRQPGQLKAKLRGSMREVRLTDLSELGGYYVGRVYEGGNYMYVRTPVKTDDGTYKEEPYFDERTAVTSLLAGLGLPTARVGWDLYPGKDGLYNRIIERSADGDRFTQVGEIGHAYTSRDGLTRRMSYWTVNPRTGGGRMTAWAGVSTRRGGRGSELVLLTENERQAAHLEFNDDESGVEGAKTGREKASEFLQSSIRSAKLNFARLMQADELIELAREETARHEAEPEDAKAPIADVPALSDNPSVAAVQKEYWAYLTGQKDELKIPGPDDEALAMLTESAAEASEDYDPEDVDEAVPGGASARPSGTYDLDAPEFGGDRAAVVRRHLSDAMDYKFGGLTASEDSAVDLPPDDPAWKGFCPSLVAVYMRSGYGPVRNKADMVEAMRVLDFTGDEFQKTDEAGNVIVKYDDFDSLAIKDRLLKFNPDRSRPLTGEDVEISPFMATVRDAVLSSLRRNGCLVDGKDPDSVRIDENGVIHYKAYMMFGSAPSPNEKQMFREANAGRHGPPVAADYSGVRTDWIKDAYTIPVEGELGQIFEPDGDGLLETRYYGSRNKLMSPGYEAYVVMPRSGAATKENLPSRYRAKNLLSVLTENISSQIRIDLQNGRGFPRGLGELSREDRERFLSADTEEARRALMAEFHIADTEHNSFAAMETREMRQDFLSSFRRNQFQWSSQMDAYLESVGSGVSAGTTTSLNYTYRRGVYSTPYKLLVEPLKNVEQPDGTVRDETLKEAYVRQQTQMLRYPVAAMEKAFKTNRDAVHFPKYLIDGSSVMEEYRHDEAVRRAAAGPASVHDVTNDNQITAWMLTGGANMAIQMENSHIILQDDKPLREDMTLAAGSVLAGPVDVADRVLPAGEELSEPVTAANGGVLPAGSAVGNFFRVPEVVMKKNAALASDVVLPSGFDVPAGTVPGADMEVGGTVYPAGQPLAAAVRTTVTGDRLPAGTVLPSDRKIAGTSVGRGSTTKTDLPIQPGTVLPAGLTPASEIPGCLRRIEAGVPLAEDTTFPAGTVFPKGFRMRVFDPAYTGSGKNQGGTRYLVVGAGITGVEPVASPDDPRLVSGELTGPNDPMAAGSSFTGSMNDDVCCELVQDNPDMPFAKNQPADRIQMTVANYHTGLSIAGTRFAQPEGAAEEYPEGHDYAHGVRVAQVAAGGFTFDDGCVFGDAFAHYFQVIGEDGKLRDICPGDKGCNMAGDKHTYAIRYDPDMPLEEQKRKGVDKVFELFRLNPGLDLVMSPYSALTRFSAANAKIGMSNPEEYGPADLVLPEGSEAGEDDGSGRRVVKGGILTVPMIVTKQTAEEHVTGYDDEDVKHGLGRKVSAQMSWVLTSAGAEKMMRCIYGPDVKSFMDTREYFITLGYDIGPTGQVLPGYAPHTDAERRFVFEGPSAALVNTDQTGAKLADTCRQLFGDVMDQKGGFMEVPFQLKFAGTEFTTDENGRPGIPLAKFLQESKNGNGMYMLPVLSAHLRSGQEWQNGERKFHEYTNWYTKIYASGVEYMRERQKAGLGPEDPPTPRMKEIQREAQRAFDSISNDVIDRRIDTKYGFARGAMMTRRMPKSATAIWTADPTLSINEIGVSADLLPVLGLKLKTETGPDGKTIPVLDGKGRMQLESPDLMDKQLLVTRDPVLDRAGVRSLTVIPVPGAKGFPDPADPSSVVEGTVGKPGDQIRGVQVNPLIAATYKGDFDGDSVGLVRLQDKDALAEQYGLFSIEQNVLDMTKKRENGDYALILNITMDAVSSEYFHPELTGMRLNLEHAANLVARGIPVAEYEEAGEDGVTRRVWREDASRKGQALDASERAELNRKIAAGLSDYTREVLGKSVGAEAISFASLDEHMNSLKVPIQHGAKGKLGNLKVYGKYYGIEPDTMAEGLEDLANAFKDLEAVPDGRPAVVDDDMRDVECATAYKAYGTGNAGSIQQMVVAFARNVVLAADMRQQYDGNGQPARDGKGRPVKMDEADPIAARTSVLDAALYITQGATQGLLQAKHDPVKAKKFYAMINGPIPELFRGHKMRYDEGAGEWVNEYETDAQGRTWPVRLSAAEWSAMAKQIFKDPKTGLGMEELNDAHFDILGQAAERTVTRGNSVRSEVIDMGRTDQLLGMGASPMDICAYTTPKRKKTVAFLSELAACQANLFCGNFGDGKGLHHSGGMSKLFMPDIVRQNEEALYGDDPDPSKVRAILPGDVKDRSRAAARAASHMDAEPAVRAKPAPSTGLDAIEDELKKAEAEIGAMRDAVKAESEARTGRRMNADGTAGRDLVAARRAIIERTGYRTELLDDSLGLISREGVPESGGVRDRRAALKGMEDYMHSQDCVQRDVDFNKREAATIELAQQVLLDYVIDKGLSDWDVRLVTDNAVDVVALDASQTMRAAELLEGLRGDLLSKEVRYGDDAGKRLVGEDDSRSVEKAARMESIRDGLRELQEMGYRQYMTVEADASYGDRCAGTVFMPGDGVRETSWFKEQQAREAAALAAERDPEELARIEELEAALPEVRDFYGAFETVKEAYGSMDGLSEDDVSIRRGQMQDMTVAMAERLQVLYYVEHRDDVSRPAVAMTGTEDLPACEEGMGFAVMQTCESLAEDVARMYEITLGDPVKAADASLDAERAELYGRLAKKVGDLNDFGFEHSAPAGADRSASEPEVQEPAAGPGERVEEPVTAPAAEPGAEAKDTEKRLRDLDVKFGHITQSAGIDGTGKTDMDDGPDEDDDITGKH